MGLYAEAAELERNGVPFAVVTITSTEGIVSRKTGRMVVSEDGRISGTIGGGEVEHKAILAALEAINEGKGRSLSIAHGHQGSVKVFIDGLNAG